ncbi:MAG: 4-hydroxyproline epimerase [Saprospiraceae bacterium]|nr:4-hydroxyproline epimerase [Saprospiraceae bacterium]
MVKKRFFCIDAHTCGNPVRLVAGGAPELQGKTMLEKRAFFLENFDWIRKSLMFEPRGHDMMSGSILYPPCDPENDVAVLFIETSGCLPMCGHGTIGTITIAIEEGLFTPKIPGKVRMEAPAGLVEIEYRLDNRGKVSSVKLKNVGSFLYKEGLEVTCPDLGKLTVDVAYGGNFYAIIDPQNNFGGIENHTADQLISWSREIRKDINDRYTFQHPEIESINWCSHVLWTGEVIDKDSTARNAVFYGDKAIDRSPSGTGTSARMAQWYAKNKLNQGDKFIHESFIGSKFNGTIEGLCKVGDYDAIIPGIEGWAKIYGHNIILVDPEDDPYAGGFQVI